LFNPGRLLLILMPMSTAFPVCTIDEFTESARINPRGALEVSELTATVLSVFVPELKNIDDEKDDTVVPPFVAGMYDIDRLMPAAIIIARKDRPIKRLM
jgi:hypothetical protein